MLAAFDRKYCQTALDPDFDPIYPDSINPSGYNSSDCGIYDPPRVISISYAWNEASKPERYVRRQCLEYLKLGLLGVTVIASSGDYGTADQLRNCLDPESGKPNASTGHFSANFPASCPWVTAVGGTQLSPTNLTWENGVTPFPDMTALDLNLSGTVVSSSGGFSNVFTAPSYQAGATTSYLLQPEHEAHFNNLSTLGYFNRHGRGLPDVSLMARSYLVYVAGTLHAATGTSASAPLFASMITMINEARLSAGKGPVGFVNPVLYYFRDKVMTDIKTGWNHGCGVSNAFPACNGWDAVTGLGSPIFQELLNLYLELP